jgi:hypothetical protein
MRFSIEGRNVDIDIAECTIAGWTGRDPAAIEHHIEELAAIGIARPSKVPLFYRVAGTLPTQAESLQVVGGGTSGEVEPVILSHNAELYLGVGSDHTDRDLEAHSVALSKQICGKPMGRSLWPWKAVADRLDRLALRSWIQEAEGQDWRLYQDGTLAAIQPLENLIAASGLRSTSEAGVGQVLFCGTFPVLSGGVRPAHAFRMELKDPQSGKSLTHSYRITALPVVS